MQKRNYPINAPPAVEKFSPRRKAREAKQNEIVESQQQAGIETNQNPYVNIQPEIIGAASAPVELEKRLRKIRQFIQKKLLSFDVKASIPG